MTNFNLTQRLNQAFIHVQMRIAVLLQDKQGQDMIEYALLGGFVAVMAGAIMPGLSHNLSTIVSKVASVMAKAATQGS
jgi:Flp pilus assembly pilin Flp